MELNINEDLWSYLTRQTKPVVIYGMGNGADKLLNVCAARGICVADVFASDAFVRGQSFRGMTVRTYSQIREKYGDGNFITLLAFATSLPDVIAQITKIASENELYAPDIPVAGDNIFDMDFYQRYKDDIIGVYEMLADDISRSAYHDIISYKLTGNIHFLLNCEHPRKEIFTRLLGARDYRVFADLGAYNGDSIRELLGHSPALRYVIALEPDPKTYRKLEKYSDSETRCAIAPLNIAAWSERTALPFSSRGNRNSGVAPEGDKIEADSLDNLLSGHPADYVKYDVEGSEMQALLGSSHTIKRYSPDLCISLYHRTEDIFLLPMLLESISSEYRFYIRRGRYLPAWDINLIAVAGG